MSGRGRGRGRGYKPPTGAQLFLQRSAQESGLDDRNLRNLQDLTRPPLFPDFTWHSSGRIWRADEETKDMVQPKRSQSGIYLIRKSREIQHRFHNSAFYLRPSQEIDVVRYRERAKALERSCEKGMLEHVGKIVLTQLVPEELLTSSRLSGANVKKKHTPFDDDAPREIKGEQADDDDEEADNLSKEAEEEEEEIADYTMNYYASEEESDGGDDEPTF